MVCMVSRNWPGAGCGGGGGGQELSKEREREREQNLSRPICRERVWPIRGPEGQSVQLGKRAQVAVLMKRQEE